MITNHVYQTGKGNKGTVQLNNLFGYVDRFLFMGGIMVTSHLVKIKFLLFVVSIINYVTITLKIMK